MDQGFTFQKSMNIVSGHGARWRMIDQSGGKVHQQRVMDHHSQREGGKHDDNNNNAKTMKSSRATDSTPPASQPVLSQDDRGRAENNAN